MADQTTQTPTPRTRRARAAAALPIALALTLIALVWLAGAIWSFEEQTHFAAAKGFAVAELLPLVLDGMALAMAAVAFAASLDGRAALGARIGTALAIAASAASNGAWAWTRSDGDQLTVTLAAGVPIVANIAFEVLLGEVRRQVQRRRGQPGPVAITGPRPVRLILAPWSTLTVWRQLVLDATDPRRTIVIPSFPAGPDRTPPDRPSQTPAPAVQTAPVRPALEQAPVRTTTTIVVPSPARRTRPPSPVRLVRPDRSDPDTADLARLRQWQTAHGGQTPSITQTQTIVGGGRSRAIRLRGLLADQPSADPERVAV